MAYEQELILLKPGVREQHIIGEIISRFERKTLKILALKLMMPTKLLIERLYKEHKDKDFYHNLVCYMISGVLVAMVVGGENAVTVSRGLVGATNPIHALPGSIRGDFGLTIPNNVVHASDSTKNAQKEIKLFFKASELLVAK